MSTAPVVHDGVRSGAEATARGLTSGVRLDDATAIVIQIGTAEADEGTL